jgi:histidinol dehydrogenase
LLAFEASEDEAIDRAAAQILASVKTHGDSAVLDATNRFDRLSADSVAALELSQQEMQDALNSLSAERRHALETAAQRVRAYHEIQKKECGSEGFSYTEADGTVLGQKVTPLDRVGIYVPGGKAAYPSSVLMNAIPAKVAGVQEIIMVVPTPDGVKNPLVLAAAAIAGVDRVFTIGGAQAVGALAYGTATIPQVDKIVGPGNAYVAAAKRRVFGTVGIDMIAGHLKFWSCAMARRIRIGLRWIYFRRLNMMSLRSRFYCAPMQRISKRCWPASPACCRRCRVRKSSALRWRIVVR